MNIQLESGRIILRTMFADRELCKALPGARWSATLRFWHCPATPALAGQIARQWPDVDLSPIAPLLPGSAQLPPDAELPLWEHQRRAFIFAEPRRATMLAMDMGTGKSRVVIDLIRVWRPARTLVICPASVVGVWPAEFTKHGEGKVTALGLQDGSIAKRLAQAKQHLALQAARGMPAVIAINYEAAWREPFGAWALGAGFDLVVCDESHRIKAPGGVSSRYLAKLGSKVERRLALTGTPMPHSPLDVYAQFRFLDVGIYGSSFTKFRLRYARMGGYGGYEVLGYQNTDELRDRFRANSFEASKDLLDLPPETDSIREFDLAPATLKIYRQMAETFVAEVKSGLITASNALVKLLRLQQLTGGLAQTDSGEIEIVGTEKCDALADVLEDVPRGTKLVVFCRFRHDLDSAVAACEAAGWHCGEISGRHKDIEGGRFPAGFDALAVQVQAGGVGIDLSAARYAIFYSMGFSLGDYLQCRSRVHRPGQVSPVTHVHLVARGTVDVKVLRALQKRAEVIEEIMQEVR